MWPIAGAPGGSFYFDNQPKMLGRPWSTRTWPLTTLPIRADPATVQILKLPAMVSPGVYSKQIPAEWPSRLNQNGFSDHFPITIRVTEID
jgi:hypothetical protein